MWVYKVVAARSSGVFTDEDAAVLLVGRDGNDGAFHGGGSEEGDKPASYQAELHPSCAVDPAQFL